MQFRKIADLLGFTRTELSVITFLLGVFLFGLAVSYFKRDNYIEKKYDYSLADSLFLSSALADSSVFDSSAFSRTSKADYRKEILGLNVRKPLKKEHIPEEKSIDLNKADEKEFTKLPGIGVKTARNIIEFRQKNGGFNNIEEMLEVKGIGHTKFERIRKYIFTGN
ncbi:MAG: ComEA family DNA-binding protein [Bacillota bacterium]